MNYSLNVYFLRITTNKVLKFTSLDQTHITPTTQPKISRTKMVEILFFWSEPVNFDTLVALIRKK